MLGKEISTANDAKEFDARRQKFNSKRSFNCVPTPRPLPCYCTPCKPGREVIRK